MKSTLVRRNRRQDARTGLLRAGLHRTGIHTAATGFIACGLAACGASLPSGGFVTGSVGEQGAHVADLARPPRQSPGTASPASDKSAADTPPKSGPAPRQTAAASATVSGSASPAVAELARAHAAEPRDVGKALAYGRALKREGKRNEALAVLDTASEVEPRHQSLRVEQGLLSLELGQSAKAEAALKEAVAGPDKDWRVYSGLGVATSTQGRHKEAQGHFNKALELSPNNPSVLNNMAVSLLLDRKVDQAEAMLRRASKDGTRPQQVVQNLALTRAIKTAAAADADAGETTAQ